ncbi:phosphoserine phosphatase SerB [Glaciecola sp. SC05]|uniref:phosphoserine phosphatase SerB n=1 Tax=Glaciecola sp. SC05 TaxID=1987355 RepID=UPI003526FA59
MFSIQAIALNNHIDDHQNPDLDSCDVLQSLVSQGNSFTFTIKAKEVQLSSAPTASQSASNYLNFSAPALSIASQSLTLRKLAFILSELMPLNTVVQLRANRFANHFATQAFDLVTQQKLKVDKHVLAAVCQRYGTDIYLKSKASLDSPGLLVMDMDSTIIAMECIDEIAELAGVKDKVAEVTERAMQGEIPFTQSLHDRVSCLAGVELEALLSIRNRLPFMPNFMMTMNILKQAGWKLGVASGGFTFFANHVKQLSHLDAAHSNELEVVDGKLTGKVLGKVVDGEEKARYLCLLAETFGISNAQTVAMGDGANDLVMMAKAGTSVAYHAKPAVSAVADIAIRFGGFEGLLFALR